MRVVHNLCACRHMQICINVHDCIGTAMSETKDMNKNNTISFDWARILEIQEDDECIIGCEGARMKNYCCDERVCEYMTFKGFDFIDQFNHYLDKFKAIDPSSCIDVEALSKNTDRYCVEPDFRTPLCWQHEDKIIRILTAGEYDDFQCVILSTSTEFLCVGVSNGHPMISSSWFRYSNSNGSAPDFFPDLKLDDTLSDLMPIIVSYYEECCLHTM